MGFKRYEDCIRDPQFNKFVRGTAIWDFAGFYSKPDDYQRLMIERPELRESTQKPSANNCDSKESTLEEMVKETGIAHHQQKRSLLIASKKAAFIPRIILSRFVKNALLLKYVEPYSTDSEENYQNELISLTEQYRDVKKSGGTFGIIFPDLPKFKMPGKKCIVTHTLMMFERCPDVLIMGNTSKSHLKKAINGRTAAIYMHYFSHAYSAKLKGELSDVDSTIRRMTFRPMHIPSRNIGGR